MPDKFPSKLTRYRRLKILMVTDGGGSFGPVDFGLSEVLRALASMPSYVRVDVTRAHRSTDSFDFDTLSASDKALLEPTYESFRFTQTGFDLTAFDEVWLIGVSRSTPSMSDPELRVLTQFMDSGGGVFATGDHENLGYALSGRVPRVRSMRKWYWSTSPADGPSIDGGPPQLRAPDGDTATRYDTLREGDPGYQFEDQSDAVPQIIEPVMRTALTPLSHVRYPHPLLCGPRGIIRVLPDHPHEGECVVPSDLTRSYTLDGYTSQEYRVSTSGHRQAPELVAHATVIGGHPTPPKPAVVGRTFGVIGAYDGHIAGVGRVSVDATWHHLFNINLIGDAGAPPGDKQVGFPANAAGLAAYADIKAYFRNIAIWLAPPAAHVAMMSAALWNARWTHKLIETLRPDLSISVIGTYARNALGQLASRCQIRSWIDIVVERHRIPEQLIPRVWGPGPFPPKPPFPPEPPEPWLQADVAENLLLGGLMAELGRAFPEPDLKHDPKEDLEVVMKRGVARGVKAMRAHVETELQGLKAHVERLEGVGEKMSRSLERDSAD